MTSIPDSIPHDWPCDFVPVILGAHIGTYGFVRSFAEAFGTPSIVVTGAILGSIRDSQIIHPIVTEPSGSDIPDSVAFLLEHGDELKQHVGGRTLVLVANSDTEIHTIAAHEDQLRQHFVFASPSQAIIDLTTPKIGFAEAAKTYGMRTPDTRLVDVGDGVDHCVDALSDMTLPLIVKANESFGYETLKWPGKAKVYRAGTIDELRAVLDELAEHTAGHRRAQHFVVQPRVPGNDTHNLSVTAYVDQSGRVTMLGSAHVLLEDHHPAALGVPAAMITEAYPHLYEQAVAFLEGVGWRGFANFDVKVDPRDGQAYFFEVNPRIGRNLYYNTAAGLNPAEFIVADLVENRHVERRCIAEHALYTVLPLQLVRRYIDADLWRQISYLRQHGRVVHPLVGPDESKKSVVGWKRRLYVTESKLNHWRKFHNYYPRSRWGADGEECLDTSALRA